MSATKLEFRRYQKERKWREKQGQKGKRRTDSTKGSTIEKDLNESKTEKNSYQ